MESLYQQIRLARLWLPLAIVGVVMVHQLFIVPLGDERWQFWAQLLFYSIVGPAVTYVTLNWIASEVRQRERAQEELRRLYTELQASHALLGAIQKVTERFATATDLDAVLQAASRGIAEVTGARATAISLGGGDFGMSHGYGLTPELQENAMKRAAAIMRGLALPELPGGRIWVLSAPLVWGEKLEGSVHAYYEAPPGPEQRESYSILVAQFSAAAEANRSRTRDLLTLFQVDQSIRAEGNLERLLETLLTQIMKRAEASLGGVYLADEDGLLQLQASHGVERSGPPVKLGEGFVGKAAASGQPSVASLGEGPILARARSALSLPLIADEGLLGVIILGHEEADHFHESMLPFLSLMAGQVTLAVRNARAYFQSEELAIVEERTRIAREIHDGIAQSLAFSALKLDLVGRLLEKQPEKAARELEGVKRTIRETIKEMRRSIFALRPIELERHGFVEAVRRYSADYSQQNDIPVGLDVGETPQLTSKSEAMLFRVFQEAMHNVAKHARATQVKVGVGTSHIGHSFISVEDDGIGFDVGSVTGRVTSAGGLGLLQMRERVEARGGCFTLTSAPGEGTKVYASVPE